MMHGQKDINPFIFSFTAGITIFIAQTAVITVSGNNHRSTSEIRINFSLSGYIKTGSGPPV
jgi:zinc transporter ZupT